MLKLTRMFLGVVSIALCHAMRPLVNPSYCLARIAVDVLAYCYVVVVSCDKDDKEKNAGSEQVAGKFLR